MSVSLCLCKRSELLRAGSIYVIYNLRETEKQTQTDRDRQTETEGDRDIETKRETHTQRANRERDRGSLRQFRCKPSVSPNARKEDHQADR